MTDGHKWLMAPKGSGALWASRSIQDILEPAIISSDNAPTTKFQDRFDYIGTRDYTSWCAMGAALDFREMLGAAGGNMCFKRVLKAGHLVTTLNLVGVANHFISNLAEST